MATGGAASAYKRERRLRSFSASMDFDCGEAFQDLGTLDKSLFTGGGGNHYRQGLEGRSSSDVSPPAGTFHSLPLTTNTRANSYAGLGLREAFALRSFSYDHVSPFESTDDKVFPFLDLPDECKSKVCTLFVYIFVIKKDFDKY